MSKKITLMLCVMASVFVFAAAFLLGGCSPAKEPAQNTYTLNLSYDSDNQTLSAKQLVCYVNTSENAFSELYFHLYANAFATGRERSVVSLNKFPDAYYNGLSDGYISMESVEIEEEEADYKIEGKEENILCVTLPQLLYPDECVTIDMVYTVKLANINHRLGVGENTINFGNFYPIACVYEEGVGFSKNPYHSNGDPFYSECANYNVKIDYDQSFTLASSGDICSQSSENDRMHTTIEANNVRDFSFVLSERLVKVSEQAEGVEVNYYGYQQDENLKQNLQVAKDALIYFNETFGRYPYSQLSVVKASFLNGGMEYPNMVLVSDEVLAGDFAYVIVHEVAHQWWYALVGNDQYNHAWMDEALAEYSTLLFFKNHPQYGEDFDEMIANAEKSYKTFVKVYTKVKGSVDGVMDKPLCEFETEPEYVQCTYTKGVLMMEGIKRTIGEKKLIKALKKYNNDFAYKTASPADFIANFIKVGGGDLEGYINSWLQDKIIIGE